MKGLHVKNLKNPVEIRETVVTESDGEGSVSDVQVKELDWAYLSKRSGAKLIDYGELNVKEQYDILIRKDPAVDIDTNHYLVFENKNIRFHSVTDLEENNRFLKIEGIVL